MKKVPLIFISYRRDDSSDVTGRIYDKLVNHFGKDAIFKDVDSIPFGVDFARYIDRQVSKCNFCLVIIGDRWLEPRLKDLNDFVRIEVESALKRNNVSVIPILVRGSDIPQSESLPESLKPLAGRNGIKVRHDPDFHNDMDRLINDIKKQIKYKNDSSNINVLSNIKLNIILKTFTVGLFAVIVAFVSPKFGILLIQGN